MSKLTPHDLRRTTISDRLDAGVNLAAAQRLIGHSNANTTARYDRTAGFAITQWAQSAIVVANVPSAPPPNSMCPGRGNNWRPTATF